MGKPLDCSKAVAYISPCGWVKGKGHRVSFVLPNEGFQRPTGGDGVEPWYWGDPNDCSKSLEMAEEMARKYNSDRGISDSEADRILLQSMVLGLDL